MPGLVIKSAVTRKADGSELYIEFLNATGVYAADPNGNEGGFGSPNPARNTLAMVFYGNHKRVEADVEAVPTIHDPLTVASYTLPITPEVNGHLNYFIMAIPIFDSGFGGYIDGDIVYDNENPVEPFIKKMISAAWVEITPLQATIEDIIIKKEGNAFVTPAIEDYRNELNAERLEVLRDLVKGKCGQDDYEPRRNDFDYVDGLFEEAVNDFCSGAFAEAQQKIEEIQDFQAFKLAA